MEIEKTGNAGIADKAVPAAQNGGNKQKAQIVLKRKIPKLLILGIIAVILIGAALLYYFLVMKGAKTANAAVNQKIAIASTGTISVTVTGSGAIDSEHNYSISPTVNGNITAINYKFGDTVKKGDVLFEIDSASAQSNLEQAENSLNQAELQQQTNEGNLNTLDVKAPFGGLVTGIQAKKGDVLQKNAAVLTITDQSKLKLVVPFNSGDASGIKPGTGASVYIQSLMQSVNGKVTYKNNKPYATAQGGLVQDVEITLQNPGSLRDGMKATASVGDADSTDSGTLAYVNSTVLRSANGGTVESVNVRENDTVSPGTVLVNVENDDLQLTIDTNSMKIQDLKNQVESAKKQLTKYTLASPVDGVIVEQDANVGDAVTPGTVIARVVDPKNMEFQIDVDELDIAKIKTGQKVSITIDALEETANNPLSGVVTKIALDGTSNNGVTTYPVTVKIDNPENLRIGMNANAEILVDSRTDVLTVPVEAVQTRGNMSFVMVRTTAGGANQNNSSGNGWQGGNGSFGNWNGNSDGNGNGSGGNNTSNSNSSTNNSTNSDSSTSGNNSRNSNSRSSSSSSTQQRNFNRAGMGGGAGAGGIFGNLFGSSSSGSKSATVNYYANTVMRMVETGLSDDSNIEITSGLNEGDVVVLPQSSSSTSSNSVMMGGFAGGPGGDFGGGNFGGGNFSGSSNRSSSSSSNKQSGN